MKDYYNAKDVQQITGASKSLAYAIIQKLQKKFEFKLKNVFKLIALVSCLGIIIYDLYMLLIYPMISGSLISWSTFGFVTFIISLIISLDIIEQIKSVSTIQPDTL